MTGDSNGGPDEEVDALLAELVAHLRATEELPVAREASAWLGEAQAVATDAARGGPPDVLRTRVEQVRDLLERIDETEHEAAAERVEAAIGVAGDIVDRLE